MKKTSHRRIYAVWFHLYEAQKPSSRKYIVYAFIPIVYNLKKREKIEDSYNFCVGKKEKDTIWDGIGTSGLILKLNREYMNICFSILKTA